MGEEIGLVRAMGGLYDGIALAGEGADLRHHPHLIAVVQIGGGLVHDQNPGLLGEGPGDENQLPLSAADLGVEAVGKIGDPQLLQRLQRQPLLLPARRRESAGLGGGPHEHHVQNGIVKGGVVGLGDIGDGAGQFPGPVGLHVSAVQGDGALVSPLEPQHAPEQGGLSHAVGPQYGEELSLSGRKAHVPQDGAAGDILKAEIAHLQAHARSPPLVMR